MNTILITGGAGFIGSNLCEYFLKKNYNIRVLDNLSTGFLYNIEPFMDSEFFNFINGDIRSIEDCRKATSGCDYVLHQAALGSVPRSINDPITTNDVNISGFLNMLIAARDSNVKRFVYAASSSTYGDSVILPKVEDKIGKPLSPYAVTKYVNELYADVFSKTYELETIGLRYFNVFGRRQNPDGAYAAVIPKFIAKLIAHESPIINGDGSFSRDFTYIDNVLQMNELALNVKDKNSLNTVYNTAYGESTTLTDLALNLKHLLSKFDPSILELEIEYSSGRVGDIPHSLASIEKARSLLGYEPQFDIKKGLEIAIDWYWNNLR